MASSLFVVLLSFLIFTAVTSIPEPELESSLTALRSKSYNLFGNAITTSDLRYEVLSGASFTLFAPLDRALFSLDMTTSAPVYVSTLRYHVVPRRLSFSDLSRSSGFLQTMLPMHQLTVVSSNTTSGVANVTVDGVEVVLPGLYYGNNIAVHGLNGILDHRSAKTATDHLSPASEPPSPVGLPPEIRAMTPEFQPLIVNHPDLMSPEHRKGQAPTPVSQQSPRLRTPPVPEPTSAPPPIYTPLSPVQLQNWATPQPQPAILPDSPAFSPSSDTSTSTLELPIYQGPVPGLVNELGHSVSSELDSGCGGGTGMQSELGPAFSLPSHENNKSEGRDL